MNTERPVNLNLFKFRFPFTAIASIIHRVTGVVLFVAIGYGLYLLDSALQSVQGFAVARDLMHQPLGKLVTWVALSALIYHFFAGIKHLLLDFDIGDSLEGSKRASTVAVGLSVIGIVAAGVWLW